MPVTFLRVLDARQTHRRHAVPCTPPSTLPAASAAPSAAVYSRRAGSTHACPAGAQTPVHATALSICASSAVSSFPQRRGSTMSPSRPHARRGAPPTLWCAVRLAPDGSRSMGFLPDTSFMRRTPKQRRPPSLQGVLRTRFVDMDAARSSSVATSNTDEQTGLTL
jgi:hypothetical protein